MDCPSEADWLEGRLNEFRRRLVHWFRKNARDLPWRRDPTPYSVWVSEVMLQQTQVEKVVGYYQRFLERFPRVEVLAAAPLEEVLRLWEGLGYYRRAVNLWKAAQIVAKDFAGQIPADLTLLCRLPGIGHYTAGAILSIGFGKPAPIVEANSRRVLTRLTGLGKPSAGKDLDRKLWTIAAQLLPRRHPGEFNQALMELGALVCLPEKPLCLICPVRQFCRAYQTGQFDLPAANGARPVEHQSVVVPVVIWGRKLLLRRCGPEERWAFLWDFPRLSDVSAEDPAQLIHKHLAEPLGLKIRKVTDAGSLVHFVTRYRIKARIIIVEVSPQSRPSAGQLGKRAAGLKTATGSANLAAGSTTDGSIPALDTKAKAEAPQAGPVASERQALPRDSQWQWINAEELHKLPLPAPSRKISQIALDFRFGHGQPQRKIWHDQTRGSPK
ncbi:MAG: A/G-specific adenine glycosylase [Thermoguttaceae bacterium]|nr:A/G-specific adenine glycosylase [Thermoguttaceae bacterium]MDW8079679.1 A/G-specific adenine glycosylase [Thermoguttaceae bacterium]